MIERAVPLTGGDLYMACSITAELRVGNVSNPDSSPENSGHIYFLRYMKSMNGPTIFFLGTFIHFF